MEKFEFKSAICTSVEQSKRLLELGLKKETADMYITNMSSKGINYTDDWRIGSIPYCNVMSFWKSKGLQLEKTAWSIIPAWSLGRLLEIMRMKASSQVVPLDDTFDSLIAGIETRITEGYFNKDSLAD